MPGRPALAVPVPGHPLQPLGLPVLPRVCSGRLCPPPTASGCECGSTCPSPTVRGTLGVSSAQTPQFQGIKLGWGPEEGPQDQRQGKLGAQGTAQASTWPECRLGEGEGVTHRGVTSVDLGCPMKKPPARPLGSSSHPAFLLSEPGSWETLTRKE